MSIRVMSRVWDHSKQSGGALLVLLAMADFANDDGICWPEVETLARKARLKPRQAQNVLKRLINDGDIEQARGGHGRGNVSLFAVLSGLDEAARAHTSAVLNEEASVKRFTRKTPQKGANITPLAPQKGANITPLAPQKGANITPLAPQKGAISDTLGCNFQHAFSGQFDPSGRVETAQQHGGIHHDPSCDDHDGDDDHGAHARADLIAFFREKAFTIGKRLAADPALDPAILRADYEARCADGQSLRVIGSYWKQAPPTQENLYVRQSSPGSDRPAGDRDRGGYRPRPGDRADDRGQGAGGRRGAAPSPAAAPDHNAGLVSDAPPRDAAALGIVPAGWQPGDPIRLRSAAERR